MRNNGATPRTIVASNAEWERMKAARRNLEHDEAFFVPGGKASVLDVTYPHRADLEETLANPIWTKSEDLGIRYRIPSLEAALANKYGAMQTPTRRLVKRLQDVVDFTHMVEHSQEEGEQAIDRNGLELLGEKVWPGGGGEEFLRLVAQVRAGQAINLDELS